VKDKTCEAYWAELESLIEELQLNKCVRKEIRYIPDGDVGLLFRASDVTVLPYRRIYQSGVLALSYAQGVPVIAADVGSIREDILEDATGLLFKPGDPVDLAAKIRAYFVSESFKDVETRERRISEYGAERFSWEDQCRAHVCGVRAPANVGLEHVDVNPLRCILITPARNEEAFIEKTIQSVVNQTVLPIRWVIVNDGSTDGTAAIVAKYAALYDWIGMVTMPAHRDRSFAAKVHCFNAGIRPSRPSTTTS